ncbi:MAG: hypoxanthine phosphoribosyltransferase [Acidobacteria bacterium]|nr:hypoxanthine phosphoribosyltransferase [Acidobacteriota bacterium]MBI3663294.1 hypoxanthine phosphoribosyltransferase [Acidobacteriota bacterium]
MFHERPCQGLAFVDSLPRCLRPVCETKGLPSAPCSRPRPALLYPPCSREAWIPVAQRSDEHLKVLIRNGALQRRIREMARQVERDFKGERVHLIGVLKGACIFLSDLIRNFQSTDVSIDFMAVASYGKGKESSGQVRLYKDLDTSIEGLNVILVEDILDTGLTLNYLCRVLKQRRPRSLRIAALLDKPSRRIQEVKADYVGFKIPNEFVVGYGLDYAERYRNLKDVCILTLPPQ